jgi:hypothetical protein
VIPTSLRHRRAHNICPDFCPLYHLPHTSHYEHNCNTCITRHMLRINPHQLKLQSSPLIRPTDRSASWPKSVGVMSRSLPTQPPQRSVTAAWIVLPLTVVHCQRRVFSLGHCERRTVDRDRLAADRVRVRVRTRAREAVEQRRRHGNDGVCVSVEDAASAEAGVEERACEECISEYSLPSFIHLCSPWPTPCASAPAAAATRETMAVRKNMVVR